MDLGLAGKRVIVTGGTRGIGAAIVERFLAEGATVAFCARNQSEVDARVSTLEAKGYKVFGAACDVSDPEAYLAWLSSSIRALGGLDVFVPNVSGGSNQGEEGWKAAFDIDMMATVRGLRNCVAELSGNKGKYCRNCEYCRP